MARSRSPRSRRRSRLRCWGPLGRRSGFYHSIVHRGDVRSIVDGILARRRASCHLSTDRPGLRCWRRSASVNYARRIARASRGDRRNDRRMLALEVFSTSHRARPRDRQPALPIRCSVHRARSEPHVAPGPAEPPRRSHGPTCSRHRPLRSSTNPRFGAPSRVPGGGVTPTVNPALSPNVTPGCAGRYDPLEYPVPSAFPGKVCDFPNTRIAFNLQSSGAARAVDLSRPFFDLRVSGVGPCGGHGEIVTRAAVGSGRGPQMRLRAGDLDVGRPVDDVSTDRNRFTLP